MCPAKSQCWELTGHPVYQNAGQYWDLVKYQHNPNVGNLLGGVPSKVPMLGTYWAPSLSKCWAILGFGKIPILGTCWAVCPAKSQCWELTGRPVCQNAGQYWDLVKSQHNPNIGNLLGGLPSKVPILGSCWDSLPSTVPMLGTYWASL